MSRRSRGQWHSVASFLGRGKTKRSAPLRSETRPLRLELLEDRRVLAAISVGNASDTINGNVTSIAALIASPGGDGISLREAILAANATPGANSITLSPGLAGATINTSNLTITGELTIKGPKGGPAILSGGSTVFHQFTGGGRILDIAAGANVTVTGLTFMNGDATEPQYTGDATGGAIRNAGSLTIRQSMFYNNGAGDTNEHGQGGGGAVSNISGGVLAVHDSSFASNYAIYGSGGAIANWGTATVVNSTFLDNTNGFNGGALFNGVGGVMTVVNSTMTKNGGEPGAAILGYPVGSGGIANFGTMALHNTIVAATNAGADVQNGGILTGSHNFIGDGSGGLADTLTGDPLLKAPAYSPSLNKLPLASAGERTFTLALLPGSPCIDAGANGQVASGYDQREAPRIDNGVVDIGAVERVSELIELVVTTLVDEDDDAVDPALGAGTSLREALSLALPEVQRITFAPGLTGTFSLTIGRLPTLTYRPDLNIIGPGADVLAIDGANVPSNDYGSAGILNIVGGNVTISGLTFTKGYAISAGGAIVSRGNLAVIACAFIDNFVDGPWEGGGAIRSTSRLSVTGSTFTGNSTAPYGKGGAIYSSWELFVTGSTFTENSADYGGAIASEAFDLDASPATPTIMSSTFIENTAARDGGAIYNFDRNYIAKLRIVESTFYQNSAALRGGGIFTAGEMFVESSTLYGNAAANTGGAYAAVGGGIEISIGDDSNNRYKTAFLKNTIVAGSTAGFDVYRLPHERVSLAGESNLIGDGSGDLADSISGDPLLGPLQDNGGPTWTMAPLPGSPAINAGNYEAFPEPLATPTGLTLTLVTLGGGLPANTTFYYRVNATNFFGETLASEEVTITSGSEPSNSVLLTWDPVPGATGYRVYGRTQGSEQFIYHVRLPSNHPDATSFQDNASWATHTLRSVVNATIRPTIDQRGLARVLGGRMDIGAVEVPSGDFNADGRVDGGDFLKWQREYGAAATPIGNGADGNGSGAVDSADLDVWRGQFGQPNGGVAAAAAVQASVPQFAVAAPQMATFSASERGDEIARPLFVEETPAVVASASQSEGSRRSGGVKVRDAAFVALAQQAEAGWRARPAAKESNWRGLRTEANAAEAGHGWANRRLRSNDDGASDSQAEMESCFAALGAVGEEDSTADELTAATVGGL